MAMRSGLWEENEKLNIESPRQLEGRPECSARTEDEKKVWNLDLHHLIVSLEGLAIELQWTAAQPASCSHCIVIVA